MGSVAIAWPSGSNVESVVLGVAGNLLTLALLLGVGVLVYRRSQRRRLVKLFAVGADSGLTMYTSCLNVITGGSHGPDGVLRNFSGRAIPAIEAKVISDFESAFRSLNSVRITDSGFLRYIRMTDIDISVEASPLSTSDVARRGTFITLGSPGYNAASKTVEDDFAPIGKFAPDCVELQLPGSFPRATVDCGILVRAVHPTTHQVAFYAAGPSEAGTAASARYLLENWRRLEKEFRRHPTFCVLVRALNADGSRYERLK